MSKVQAGCPNLGRAIIIILPYYTSHFRQNCPLKIEFCSEPMTILKYADTMKILQNKVYIYPMLTSGGVIAQWLTRLVTHPEIKRSNRADTHGPLTHSPVSKRLPNNRQQKGIFMWILECHNMCEPATIQARVRT